MNIVTYLGQEFKVPDWAKFLAADHDGAVYAFDKKPVLEQSVNIYFSENANARSEYLDILQISVIPPEGFPIHSLEEVEINPAVEQLISQLHSGAISARTLFPFDI